jgi:CheY-like chemotaxis protein
MEKRVLIVTPNTHLAQALETMLGYFHFPIAVAQQASDLNHLFKDKGPFDMYFVDETVFAETLGQLLAHKRSGKLILVQEAGRQELISKKFRQYVDGILTKPFTQGALFNTILEVFAEDSLEGKRESLKILKENIVMLGEGKSLLYLGEENSDWILIQNLLEGTGVKLKRIDDPQKLLSEAAKADLLLLGHLPEEKQATVEKLLPRLGEGKPILQIQSKEVLQDLTGPEAYAKLGETLVSPIDPELFYRLLFDALL